MTTCMNRPDETILTNSQTFDEEIGIIEIKVCTLSGAQITNALIIVLWQTESAQIRLLLKEIWVKTSISVLIWSILET